MDSSPREYNTMNEQKLASQGYEGNNENRLVQTKSNQTNSASQILKSRRAGRQKDSDKEYAMLSSQSNMTQKKHNARNPMLCK
jgi:hypothetical protein